MTDKEWLAERFEEHRGRLNTLAYRILGSHAEAEETVQDAWIRLSGSDADQVEDLGHWLTTVVSRLCLNVLQSRRTRAEEPFDLGALESLPEQDAKADPEEEAILADSIGLALLIVLDQLTPTERVAFVLHDMFDIPFNEIAPILGKSGMAARQLASRARRRVRHADVPSFRDELRRHRLVSAFLAASRNRDFQALLRYLDPSVVMRVDKTALELGAIEIRGREEVARSFAGRMGGAQPALVSGALGAVWAPGGTPKVVFNFKVIGDKIVEVELIGDAERLRTMNLELHSIKSTNRE
jgi:RNA polymerase sigma factor (sigma-70 family)